MKLRDLQRATAEFLKAMEGEFEVTDAKGEVLCYLSSQSEKGQILKKLDAIEALLASKPSIPVQASHNTTYSHDPAYKPTFQELQNTINQMEGKTPVSKPKIYRKKCRSCFQARELFRFWEEGEDYELCAPCLQLKFGKAASKYTIPANLVEDEEPVQTVPTATVSPTYRISTECVRPTVQMCATCKFQAVTAGQKFCPKCKPKKK